MTVREKAVPASLEQSESFADGIEKITVQGGIVRVDFVSLAPHTEGRDAQGRARVAVRRRIILPLGGFVKSFQTMQRTIEQLAEQGALQVDVGGSC